MCQCIFGDPHTILLLIVTAQPVKFIDRLMSLDGIRDVGRGGRIQINKEAIEVPELVCGHLCPESSGWHLGID